MLGKAGGASEGQQVWESACAVSSPPLVVTVLGFTTIDVESKERQCVCAHHNHEVEDYGRMEI